MDIIIIINEHVQSGINIVLASSSQKPKMYCKRDKIKLLKYSSDALLTLYN